jgi:hypothetical protein
LPDDHAKPLALVGPPVGLAGPTRARTWAVFGIALGVYLLTWRGHVSGWHRIARPSPHHLYVHQADAWLDGHLDVRTFRSTLDVTPFGSEQHVCFPPAPAVLLLPLVAVWKLETPVMLFQVAAGAASVVFLYRALWSCNQRLGIGAAAVAIEGATALYALGTQVWINVAWEGHSFTAHMVSLAALSAAFWAAAERKGFLTGLGLCFAIASRQATIGAAPLLIYLLCGPEPGCESPVRRRRILLRAAIMPAVGIALMAWHNQARFGSPLEFGYQRLMLADKDHAGKSPHGLVSLRYVPRNAWYFFLQPPKFRPLPPYFHSRPMGMALWFITPAFLLLFTRLPKLRWQRLAWGCVGLTLVPALLYHYTGFYQWGCRFLLDVHPMLLLLFLARIAPVPRWWHTALIALSMAFTFEGVFIKHLRWFWPDLVL